MNRLFLIALAGNWLSNPLGIMLAQYFGLANNPEVIIMLLSVSLSAPFQLYLNECMSLSAARDGGRGRNSEVAVIIGLQIIVYFVYFKFFYGLSYSFTTVFIMGVFLAFSNIISYRISSIFYVAVMQGVVDQWRVFIVGVLPGIVNLFSYIVYVAFMLLYDQRASFVILSAIMLPSLVQWWYVKSVVCSNGLSSCLLNEITKKKSSQLRNLSFVIVVAGLSVFGVMLRERISEHSANYMGLIIVILNALSTVVVVMTRKKHLMPESHAAGSYSVCIIIFLVALASLSFYFGNGFNLLFLLIGNQVLIAIVLNLSRKPIMHFKAT